jgi:hypothetical protein
MNDEEALAAVRGVLTQARDSLDGVHMQAPAAALVAAARARQKRHWLSGSVAACAALAIGLLLVGVVPASGQAPGKTGNAAGARTVAYVVKRVEQALAGTHLVFVGHTASNTWGPSVTWVYGPRNRFEEFTGKACGHVLRNGECTHHGGSVPYLAQGTALVHGTLKGAYVTYFDRRYSLSPVYSAPASACSKDAALSMGGPPVPTPHWSAFINSTLACGAAHVTGHVWLNGVETTKITGKPVVVRLSRGYSSAVHEKMARARWILWVNSETYLPVRTYGSTETFGGPQHSFTSSGVTNVTWLPPTRANIASALVHIPPGFQQWRGSPGNQ